MLDDMNDKLLLVAVSSGSALFGVLVSQLIGLLAGRIDRLHKRDVRRREKLDELSAAVVDSMSLVEEMTKSMTVDDLKECELSRIQSVVPLVMQYFPELTNPASAYVNSLAHDYYIKLLDFLEGRTGEDAVDASRSHLHTLRNRLDVELAKVARRYDHV